MVGLLDETFHPTTLERGITIREWFAGQALAGFCANPACKDVGYKALVVASLGMASAMVEALEKEKK